LSVAFHSEDGASSPLPHALRYLPSHLSLNRTIPSVPQSSTQRTDVAMASCVITDAGEKQFAVVRFHVDDETYRYSTCSQRNKAADSARFVVGEEVTIQWSNTKHQLYKGVVVFTNGRSAAVHVLHYLYTVLRYIRDITLLVKSGVK